MGVDWPEIQHLVELSVLMEVYIMFDIWTYFVFTLYDRK